MTFILVFTLFVQNTWAKQSAEDLEFHGGSTHYQIHKSPSEFSFRDRLGNRSLTLKKCNRNLINTFWKKLSKNIYRKNKAQFTATKPTTNDAWIRINGSYASLQAFEPAYKDLNRIPQRIHVLFTEERRRCK